MIRYAKKYIDDSPVRIAAVAGAFPSGQTSLAVKLMEVKFAIGEGANEIDTVINRGLLLEGSYQQVFDEIAAIKEACGEAHLKVILETGELNSIVAIRKASEIAINAGADFIKTSTGKVAVGATFPAFLIMLDTIKEYVSKTGKAIGIKPAGGIRTTGQAIDYYNLVNGILGEQWTSPNFFRIGASSLLDDLLAEFDRSS
jgi:deoxyribose-phosphate aldolase